jgi:hypothetical protein
MPNVDPADDRCSFLGTNGARQNVTKR